MVDLGTYKDKFGDTGKRVFEHAVRESRNRDQNYIAVEHILNALAAEEQDLFNDTLRALSVDARTVRATIEQRLTSARLQHTACSPRLSPPSPRRSRTGPTATARPTRTLRRRSSARCTRTSTRVGVTWTGRRGRRWESG